MNPHPLRIQAVCRPRLENVPTPPAGADWRQVNCQRCGVACWERPGEESRLKDSEEVRYLPVCTLCAMQRGLSFHG